MSESEPIVFDLDKKGLILISLFMTLAGFYAGSNALAAPADTLARLPITVSHSDLVYLILLL